jgi:hypothetical protein
VGSFCGHEEVEILARRSTAASRFGRNEKMLFSSGPLLWQDLNCGREGPLFSPLFFQ